MTALMGGLVVRSLALASSSRRVRLVAGASLGACAPLPMVLSCLHISDFELII